MKIICLGGALASFAPKFIAGGVANLEDIVSQTEPFVLVCHGGSPYLQQSAAEGLVDPILDPELLTYKLHGVLLAHRKDHASPPQVERLKKDLEHHCRRVFGMTRGWNEINLTQRSKLISFLESDDNAPGDDEVRTLLGYDFPISKLALRVALEIALRELSAGPLAKRPGAAMSVKRLLAPALALAEQEPSLAPSVTGISRALAADHKSLPQEITHALSELSS